MDNEQVLDSGVQVEAPSAEPVTDTSVSEAPAESPQSAPAEKMYTQAQANAIMAKVERKAEERARGEARAEYERQIAQAQAAQAQPQSLGGIQQQSSEQVRQMIHEEAWRMTRESQAKQIESNWESAMDAERMSDPEFGKLYDALQIEKHPELVIWMSGMDNKAAAVKELAQNPGKYATVLMLAKGDAPELAKMELNKLSASIKANEQAKKAPQVDAPLSQIKSSNLGVDNGNMSVTDYRAMFRG